MTKRIVIILALTTAWASTALAGSLHVGQVSHHFIEFDNIEWRTKHPYLVYEDTETGVLFGYLRNSYNDDSWLLGRKFIRKETPIGEFGLKGGLVSGYEEFPAFLMTYWRFKIFEVNYLPTQMVSVGFVFKLN